MKIVVLDGNAVNPGDLSWDFLCAYGDVQVYPRTAAKDVLPRMHDADIILTNKVNITPSIMDACPHLKLICVLATGYNVIDVEAATARSIAVCNVPSYGTAAVCQFTFSLLLELCNRVGHHETAVRNGKWASCPDFCFWETPQMELAGKTIGIIGFGRIGKAVATVANAFGMNVMAYSRTQNAQDAVLGTLVDLDTLLSQSDIISLHCPLTPQTAGIINQAAIEKMKDGAILINTARGPLVDEHALAQALRTGKLRGAAMDVLTQEPPDCDNVLIGIHNCILTPHMAWSPIEARQRILNCTEESIRAFLAGSPINTVNM